MKNNKNKGVTLIALTVTIIVLVILASVSISMLKGENGIINQAKNSKEQTEISNEKEQIELSAVQASSKSPYGNIIEDNLIKALDSNIGEGNYSLEILGNRFRIIYIKTETQRSYILYKDGDVEIEGDSQY